MFIHIVIRKKRGLNRLVQHKVHNWHLYKLVYWRIANEMVMMIMIMIMISNWTSFNHLNPPCLFMSNNTRMSYVSPKSWFSTLSFYIYIHNICLVPCSKQRLHKKLTRILKWLGQVVTRIILRKTKLIGHILLVAVLKFLTSYSRITTNYTLIFTIIYLTGQLQTVFFFFFHFHIDLLHFYITLSQSR